LPSKRRTERASPKACKRRSKSKFIKIQILFYISLKNITIYFPEQKSYLAAQKVPLKVFKKDIFKNNFEVSVSFLIIVMKYLLYYIFIETSTFT